MAIKKNLGAESDQPQGNVDPTSQNTNAEAVKPVVRKKRSTVQKMADAVTGTVKELADKVIGKSAGATIRKSATAKKLNSSSTKPADTPRPPTASKNNLKVNDPKVNETSSASRSKNAIKRTEVGALTADVTSEDVRESLNDLTNSEDLIAKSESGARTEKQIPTEKVSNPGPPPPQPSRDVPDEYGDTRIVLLVRDPEWVFAYWEINDETRNAMSIPRNGSSQKFVLRLYKVTGRDWPSEAAHYFFDVDVSADAKSWYVHLPEANEAWCAELGMIDGSDNYTHVCRSNPVNTPPNSISEELDSEWMTVEESFEKITRLSGGGTGAHLEKFLRGDTENSSETILRHVHRQLTGGFPGERVSLSSGIFSSESAMRHKDFWLQVHTELILYGATEPDAKVTVQGRPVDLSDDGTFSIRYALPDGEQVLDVRARNADDDMEETRTPVVVRSTR